MGSMLARVAALAIAGIVLLSGGCTVPKGEGFAIYLTKADVTPDQMPVLSHIDIAERPTISSGDIAAYDAGTHEITLTASAYERISGLDVPVRGRTFVVCVDRKPIYWGAFWTSVSSISFAGVTIVKPLRSSEGKVVKLQTGYPSSAFFQGEDPRSNAGVIESLEQAGKLR